MMKINKIAGRRGNASALRQKRKKGQTFIEYTLLIAIILAVLSAATPMIRRGIQGMIKVVADQVGRQQNAEQTAGNSGYLISQFTAGRGEQTKRVLERVGTTNYVFGGRGTNMSTETITNLGFTKQ